MKTDNETYKDHSNLHFVLARWNSIFWTAILFVLLFLPIWWFADQLYEERLLSEQHTQDTIELHLLKNSLEVAISNRFGLLEGLGAFAESNPTEQLLNKEYKIFTSVYITASKV